MSATPFGLSFLGRTPLGCGPLVSLAVDALPLDFEGELLDWLNALGLASAWPGLIPQTAKLPALVVNVISSETSYNAADADGLVVARVQIDAYGSTRTVAHRLAETVAARLTAAGQAGFFGPVPVDWIDRDDESTGFDPLDNGSARATQRKRIDFQFAFYRT